MKGAKEDLANAKRKSETTYIWQGKIDASSHEVEQIRVGVLVEDWEHIEAQAAVTADADADPPIDAADAVEAGDELLASFAYGGTPREGSPRGGSSPPSGEFNIDANRPRNPAGNISGILLEELNKDKEFKGLADLGEAATKAGGFEGATGDLHVGGIGDRLSLSVKLGPNRAAEVLGDHSLQITIHDKKLLASELAGDRSLDVFNFKHVIASGDFGDVANTPVSITAHVLDAAKNASCEAEDGDGDGSTREESDACADGADNGVSAPADFRLDAKAPDATKDSLLVVKGRHLRARGDTLTDGTVNSGFQDDLNALSYDVPEALGKLEIIIKAPGAKDDTGTNLTVTGSAYDHAALGNALVDAAKRAEFKFVAAGAATADEDPVAGTASLGGTLTGPGSGKKVGETEDDHPAFADGMKTVKVTATDLAGNTGPSQEYSVYMDASDVTFGDVFPEAGIATLEAETAKVRFKLSEDADSVLISYTETQAKGKSGDPEGNDEDSPRTFALTGDDLLNNSSYQRKTVSGLVDDTWYELSLLGADLAGNYAKVVIDTFRYDEEYDVPTIASFKITSEPKGGLADDAVIGAGSDVVLTITAMAAPEEGEDVGPKAHTYDGEALLTVQGDGTIKFHKDNKDVDTEGQAPGVIQLEEGGWSVGVRMLTFSPESAPANHRVLVEDDSDADNEISDQSDSVFVTTAAKRHHILLDTDAETVDYGGDFMVNIALVDTFDNTRLEDDGFVQVTTPAVGVQIPSGPLAVTDGVASFAVRSTTFEGDLVLTARSVSVGNDVKDEAIHGPVNIIGDLTVTIGEAPPPPPDPDPPPPPTAPDAPDTLFAQDYKGALGTGDQGGFVFLTWDASDDHGTLSGYRIYRQLRVNVLEDQTGAGKLMLSEEGEDVDVPWATVDAVPGEDIMRVVVATLDGYATKYGVSAERAGLRSFPPTSHQEPVGGMDSTPVWTTPVWTTPVWTTPVWTTPVWTTPAMTMPVMTMPVMTMPVMTMPVMTMPVMTMPVMTMPVMTMPARTTPARTTPARTTPGMTWTPSVPSPSCRSSPSLTS